MVTGAPPPNTLRPASPHKRPVWPWAVGSILIPLVIVVATLAGARFVSRERLAAMVAPAPKLPPLRVAGAIQPPMGVALWALASLHGDPTTLIYTTSAAPSACLPGAACPTSLANRLTIYDATGAPVLTRSIPPADLSQCALLSDDASPFAYLVCPGQVQEISLATGQTTRQLALPA